jgi:hypothetical protein
MAAAARRVTDSPYVASILSSTITKPAKPEIKVTVSAVGQRCRRATRTLTPYASALGQFRRSRPFASSCRPSRPKPRDYRARNVDLGVGLMSQRAHNGRVGSSGNASSLGVPTHADGARAAARVLDVARQRPALAQIADSVAPRPSAEGHGWAKASAARVPAARQLLALARGGRRRGREPRLREFGWRARIQTSDRSSSRPARSPAPCPCTSALDRTRPRSRLLLGGLARWLRRLGSEQSQ